MRPVSTTSALKQRKKSKWRKRGRRSEGMGGWLNGKENHKSLFERFGYWFFSIRPTWHVYVVNWIYCTHKSLRQKERLALMPILPLRQNRIPLKPHKTKQKTPNRTETSWRKGRWWRWRRRRKYNRHLFIIWFCDISLANVCAWILSMCVVWGLGDDTPFNEDDDIFIFFKYLSCQSIKSIQAHACTTQQADIPKTNQQTNKTTSVYAVWHSLIFIQRKNQFCCCSD